ncbi:MAG: repeat-containing glycosyl hydrolase, partial [Clostridiaceae bacterium]|nr:repeat-containing glycosyl hydrolase [Clostridiaceae bacterium]
MIIENKLTKRKYRSLVLRELLFGNIRTIIMLVLYCIAWRILYSVAKVGQLKRNVPLFLGVSFILLLILINICVTCHTHMKNSFFYNTGRIMVDNDKLAIETDEYADKIIYPWDSLTKVKENRKWYFLFFNDRSFLPISKEASGEMKDYLQEYKPVRRTYKKLSALAFVIVTACGIYYVGTCAVNFNGDLAWKINELKTDKKSKLQDMNLYTLKLQGIINILKDKEKTEPNLMTNSVDIKFEKDGTIISFETYIYGFDNNYNLKSGYLLYYDRSKSSKVTIHKQDWG